MKNRKSLLLWAVFGALIGVLALCSPAHAVPGGVATLERALYGWTPADGKHVEGTLANEGLWVNDPSDPGKETYRGIARKFNPRWDGWGIIDAEKRKLGRQPKFGTRKYYAYARKLDTSLKGHDDLKSSVVRYYHGNQWTEMLGDLWEGMYLPYKVLDVGVNCGTGSIALCLVDTVNELNGTAPDLAHKPVITRAMVQWINAYTKDDITPLDFQPVYPGDPRKPGGKDSTRRMLFLSVLKGKVELHYGKVIEKNPKMLAWKKVWDRRLYMDE